VLEYAIVANPAAGRMGLERSRLKLRLLSRRLNCPLLGLDCRSVEEFRRCVAEVSRRCEVLLIAGGDGSFAEAVNSLALEVTLGFLPLGSGNALDYALGRRCSSPAFVQSILQRRWISIPLMLCNGSRKSLMAGVGLDAEAVRRVELRGPGKRKDFLDYGLGLLQALAAHQPGEIEIRAEGWTYQTSRHLTAIVSKHPFFGYGLRVSRGVSLPQPLLALRLVEGGRLRAALLLAAGALGRRPVGGLFWTGRRFHLTSAVERWLQCDGDLIEAGKEFSFELHPQRLRLIF